MTLHENKSINAVVHDKITKKFQNVPSFNDEQSLKKKFWTHTWTKAHLLFGP